MDGRGRGRAARCRAHARLSDPRAFRMDFPQRWSALVRHLFATREALAADFGVTFQTACNWWDGACRPTGDVVAAAALNWPEDFARFMGA